MSFGSTLGWSGINQADSILPNSPGHKAMKFTGGVGHDPGQYTSYLSPYTSHT
jgi:hypothetical protein